MLKKGGRGWSVVGVPDSALVPEGAGVRAAGGLLWASVSVRRAALCAASVSSWGGTVRKARALHVGCRLANTARLRATSFAWGLRRPAICGGSPVEPSSFAPGCAGWALRRLRGWVIRVWQIAERFCLGLAREPSALRPARRITTEGYRGGEEHT